MPPAVCFARVPTGSPAGNFNIARLFVFAFDLNEASQIRRVRSLIAAGHEVCTASFRRDNMNDGFVPDWPNIDLGQVKNQSFGRRMLKMAAAVRLVLKSPTELHRAEVIVARNFDLLFVAWASRFLLRRGGTPLVYECLDIHGLFTRAGLIGVIMRWSERRLLSRVQLLIVSSPGFVRNYFGSVQGYDGVVSVVENKLWFDTAPIPRPSIPRSRAPDAPLSLGWVGSIRCRTSLNILTRVADNMGKTVSIEIHGNIHRHTLPDFDEVIGARANIHYHGPYFYPQDLATVYGGCDLVWAQDLWQRGANSDWLLPNRIYEASWFGCPSIAVADTETGRRVTEMGLGFTVSAPDPAELTAMLGALDRNRIAEKSGEILAIDGRRFRLCPEDISNALAPVL